jgi:hypothetical protein
MEHVTQVPSVQTKVELPVAHAPTGLVFAAHFSLRLAEAHQVKTLPIGQHHQLE